MTSLLHYTVFKIKTHQEECVAVLTLKVPCKIVVDNILEIYIYIFSYFSVKVRLDISCESSA